MKKNNNTLILDNLIIINGGSPSQIKKALNQWICLYSEDLKTNVTFEFYKNSKGSYIIKADSSIDNNKFYYLVNYLQYPEGIEYNINVKGFTTGSDKNELLNKKLLIYISDDDTDGDNVFAITSDDETFKIDFGGEIVRVSNTQTYLAPIIEQLSDPEIIVSDSIDLNKYEQEKSKYDLGKRFIIILMVFLGLILLSFLTLYKNTETFFEATRLLGFGLGCWFFWDYKILQVRSYYLISFLASIGFLIYVFIIIQIFPNSSLTFLHFGVLCPITILLFQKPLRYLFIKLLKREPIVDKPPRSFWDLIYSLILISVMVVLPLILIKLFK